MPEVHRKQAEKAIWLLEKTLSGRWPGCLIHLLYSVHRASIISRSKFVVLYIRAFQNIVSKETPLVGLQAEFTSCRCSLWTFDEAARNKFYYNEDIIQQPKAAAPWPRPLIGGLLYLCNAFPFICVQQKERELPPLSEWTSSCPQGTKVKIWEKVHWALGRKLTATTPGWIAIQQVSRRIGGQPCHSTGFKQQGESRTKMITIDKVGLSK